MKTDELKKKLKPELDALKIGINRIVLEQGRRVAERELEKLADKLVEEIVVRVFSPEWWDRQYKKVRRWFGRTF